MWQFCQSEIPNLLVEYVVVCWCHNHSFAFYLCQGWPLPITQIMIVLREYTTVTPQHLDQALLQTHVTWKISWNNHFYKTCDKCDPRPESYLVTVTVSASCRLWSAVTGHCHVTADGWSVVRRRSPVWSLSSRPSSASRGGQPGSDSWPRTRQGSARPRTPTMHEQCSGQGWIFFIK